MAKSVRVFGELLASALVIFGCTSFVGSFFVESPIIMVLLKVIARVLP